MKSRRSGGTSGGGIRKRGPTRTDRDGDMDMDRPGVRGGKRGRGDTGRPSASGRPQARERNLDLLQKAVSGGKDSQANIRQGKGSGGSNLEQFSVRNWKDSKAASNRDGGVESLTAFLERRLNASTKSGPRAKITKVCSTFEESVHIYQRQRHPYRCLLARTAFSHDDGRHFLGFLAISPLGDGRFSRSFAPC